MILKVLTMWMRASIMRMVPSSVKSIKLCHCRIFLSCIPSFLFRSNMNVHSFCIRTNCIINKVIFRETMLEAVSFILAFCRRVRGRSTSMARTRETLTFLSWAVIIPIMKSSSRTLLLKSS